MRQLSVVIVIVVLVELRFVMIDVVAMHSDCLPGDLEHRERLSWTGGA